MKIVVLDGATLNPGDLSWTPLRELGEVDVYPDSSASDILPRAAGAQVVMTNKVVFDREVLGALPALEFVSVLATGYDVIDIEAARSQGVSVSNVPAYATDAVAQHVFALLLRLTNHVTLHDAAVRNNEWMNADGFTFWNAPLVELAGHTMGIVGAGRIGQAVARIAAAFGMDVLEAGRDDNVTELFAASNVVSLHCPLTPETQHLANAERLRAMPPGGYLINTSRGGLVDSGALSDALTSGHLAGAALDVVDGEPIGADHPLLGAPNVVVTPHNAWTCRASRQRLLDTSIGNVRAFVDGTPQHLVT